MTAPPSSQSPAIAMPSQEELANARDDACWWDVIEAGWKAGMAGDDPRFNPYPQGTEEWQCWNRWLTIAVESLRE